MYKSLILSSFLVASAVFSCSAPQNKSPEAAASTEISVKSQVDNGAMFVDVRTPGEFAKGTYAGAVNIPLDQIEGRISEFKNKPGVVVFCRSGNRSSQAKDILEKNGIKNVSNGVNVEEMKKAAH